MQTLDSILEKELMLETLQVSVHWAAEKRMLAACFQFGFFYFIAR